MYPLSRFADAASDDAMHLWCKSQPVQSSRSGIRKRIAHLCIERSKGCHLQLNGEKKQKQGGEEGRGLVAAVLFSRQMGRSRDTEQQIIGVLSVFTSGAFFHSNSDCFTYFREYVLREGDKTEEQSTLFTFQFLQFAAQMQYPQRRIKSQKKKNALLS